jgi:hypothetical protein
LLGQIWGANLLFTTFEKPSAGPTKPEHVSWPLHGCCRPWPFFVEKVLRNLDSSEETVGCYMNLKSDAP